MIIEMPQAYWTVTTFDRPRTSTTRFLWDFAREHSRCGFAPCPSGGIRKDLALRSVYLDTRALALGIDPGLLIAYLFQSHYRPYIDNNGLIDPDVVVWTPPCT